MNSNTGEGMLSTKKIMLTIHKESGPALVAAFVSCLLAFVRVREYYMVFVVWGGHCGALSGASRPLHVRTYSLNFRTKKNIVNRKSAKTCRQKVFYRLE